MDCQQPVFQPRPFSSGPDLPPSRAYAPEYYPSAADSKSAEVIDLAPGAEKSGVDFQMKSEAVTQIHGTFGGDLWRGHQNMQFILINTNTTAANRMVSAPPRTHRKEPSNSAAYFRAPTC